MAEELHHRAAEHGKRNPSKLAKRRKKYFAQPPPIIQWAERSSWLSYPGNNALQIVRFIMISEDGRRAAASLSTVKICQNAALQTCQKQKTKTLRYVPESL